MRGLVELYKTADEIAPNKSEVVFGDTRSRGTDLIYLGNLAEIGTQTRKVWMDVSGEQVVAIVGKRGSGKSYTLGTILEALSVKGENSAIAKVVDKRGILLIDTLDIFWPSKFVLSPEGPPQIKQQYEVAKRWGLKPEQPNVSVWVPSGFERSGIDPEDFQKYQLGVSDFDAYDWASLLNVDLITEPRGQLLNEAYSKVVGGAEESWESSSPKEYSVQELVDCIENDPAISSDYTKETKRAVVQRLQAYANLSVISKKGTPLTDLIVPGKMSVLMVGRLNDDLRSVLTAVMLRKIFQARGKASFIRKRLKTDPTLTPQQKSNLESAISSSVPRCWVAIDEAQNVIPSDRKTSAQDVVIKLVKEGRNYGISFCLTTQQPSAIDTKVMSQVITFIVHQLAMKQDIEGVRNNLHSAELEKVVAKRTELDFPSLLRSLDPGQAVVSSDVVPGINRSFVVNIRPRVSVHGGFED